MNWNVALNDLQAQLDEQRTRLGLEDAVLGHHIYATLRDEPLSDTIPAQDPLRDTLARLTWWMFVRAPYLRPSYALLSAMTLDLVLEGDRPLASVLEDLATLEQAALEGVEEDPGVEGTQVVLEIYATHGASLDAIFDASGAALLGLLRAPLDALQGEHLEAFTLLQNSVMDELITEFDSAARRDEFKELLDEPSRPSLPELGSAAAYVERALLFYERGELELALEDLDVALARDHVNVDARIARATILAAGMLTERALEDLDAALSHAPDHLLALTQRGLLHMGRHDFEAALQDYDRVLSLAGDDPTAHLNRSNIRVMLGDLEGAVEDAEAAMHLSPDDPTPWVQRAMLRRQMGNAAGAIADYSHAIAKNHEEGDAWAGRGFLYLELGESAPAIADFSRAITLQPHRAVLFYNRGTAFAEEGAFEEAITDFTRSIELDPEDTDALVNRGIARLKLEDLKGALEDWDRAILVDPYHPSAYYRRGAVLAASEEYEYALRDFERVLELVPQDWPGRGTVVRQRDRAREVLGNQSD